MMYKDIFQGARSLVEDPSTWARAYDPTGKTTDVVTALVKTINPKADDTLDLNGNDFALLKICVMILNKMVQPEYVSFANFAYDPKNSHSDVLTIFDDALEAWCDKKAT